MATTVCDNKISFRNRRNRRYSSTERLGDDSAHGDLYVYFKNYPLPERIWDDLKGSIKSNQITPSCESTGITTNCWTISDRKTLELSKKDTPHPKTKEKLQGDGRRGAITIKSNPITTGWVTPNQRTLIPQKSTHWSEGSEPHVRLPNLGVQQWGEEFLENQTLKAGGIWLQDFNMNGGNRDSTLGGHT